MSFLRSLRSLGALLLALWLLPVPASLAAPPAEGDCPTVSASPEDISEGAVDATPLAIEEGMKIDHQSLLVLRRLLPGEIWRQREVFFFEGMSMEIGWCHRRYTTPGFYKEATEKHRGKPRLDKDGNLRDYEAGVPFPPEDIDPDAPDAGTRWAWNLQMRYRGAGHRGRFRMAELPSRIGGVLLFEGDFAFLQTGHRSDVPDQDYTVGDDDELFAAGGNFTKPFDARHLAWRQLRPLKSVTKYKAPDDTFVYVPTMRKMRRSATSWVDGLFFPRYTAGGDAGGGGLPVSGIGGGGGAINPTAGQSIVQSEHIRRGFIGIAIRPNAYVWRYRGEADVLAPINVGKKGWPRVDNRNFGPSGLSVASDRWDVRRAVIIEGAMKMRNEDVGTVTVLVDYQTRVPLYWITRTKRRRLMEIGILVHRFTGDVPGYPEWPGGFPADVFEPVAAAFYNALDGGGGWRRESYDLSSLPFEPNEVRRLTSSTSLGRGH